MCNLEGAAAVCLFSAQQFLHSLDNVRCRGHDFFGQSFQLRAVAGSISKRRFSAAAKSAGSFTDLSKASRKIFNRSAGNPEG